MRNGQRVQTAEGVTPFDVKTHCSLPIAHRAPCRSVAVLVAGGFHTLQLTNLLREKNISYLVITPTVESVTAPIATLCQTSRRSNPYGRRS